MDPCNTIDMISFALVADVVVASLMIIFIRRCLVTPIKRRKGF